MINMGKPPRGRSGAGPGDGFPALTHLALNKWKLLTAVILFAALLVMGFALQPAATLEKNAAGLASGTAIEPGRNILIGLAALGMTALGAATARLIGGSLPEYPCGGIHIRFGFIRRLRAFRIPAPGGLRIHFGFFRHFSDRSPLGRALGRRGGEA